MINATADIYRAAVDADLIKGRSIDSILAAALYGGREVGPPNFSRNIKVVKSRTKGSRFNLETSCQIFENKNTTA